MMFNFKGISSFSQENTGNRGGNPTFQKELKERRKDPLRQLFTSHGLHSIAFTYIAFYQ